MMYRYHLLQLNRLQRIANYCHERGWKYPRTLRSEIDRHNSSVWKEDRVYVEDGE